MLLYADPKFCNLVLVRWYKGDSRICDVLSKRGCKKVQRPGHPHKWAAEYYERINLLCLRVERPPSAGEDDEEGS